MIDPWSAPPPGQRGLTYLCRRAVECVQDGVTAPSCIARRLRISRNHASVLLCKLKQKGIAVPTKKSINAGHALQIKLSDDEKAEIEKQAMRRGLSAQLLTQTMVSVIIRDRLYDAVIDGGE